MRLSRRAFLAALIGNVGTAWAINPGRVIGRFDVLQPVNTLSIAAPSLMLWLRSMPERSRSKIWFDLVRHLPGITNNFAFPATSTSGFGPTTRRGSLLEARFDGTAWVDAGTPDGFTFANTAWSFSCWFRCTNNGNDGYLMARRSISSNVGGYLVRINASDGTIQGRLIDSSGTQAAVRGTVSTGLYDNTWRHLLVTFITDTVTIANNDIHLYINGISNEGGLGTSGTGAYTAPAHILTFGSSADQESTTFLSGALDDIQFWRRGFTAQQALALYQQSLLGFPRLLNELPVPHGMVPTLASLAPAHRIRR